MAIHSPYLSRVFDPESFEEVINTAVRKLRRVEFDALAVTGNSGTLVGGAVAFALHKPLILVRKSGDNSHATVGARPAFVEGDDACQTYLFFDDMICTGKTRSRVQDTIKARFPHMKCLGYYEYNSGFLRTYDPAPDSDL